MKRQRKCQDEGYDRFLFRATGGRGTGPVTDVELADNLIGELERLHAIEELLARSPENEDVPPGLADLLRDIRERARALLDLWWSAKERLR